MPLTVNKSLKLADSVEKKPEAMLTFLCLMWIKRRPWWTDGYPYVLWQWCILQSNPALMQIFMQKKQAAAANAHNQQQTLAVGAQASTSLLSRVQTQASSNSTLQQHLMSPPGSMNDPSSSSSTQSAQEELSRFVDSL